MKRISFVLAILWLLSESCLIAQNQGVEFYRYNSDNIRILESLLQYQMQPNAHGILDINGQSSWEERLNFNQETRRSRVGSSYGYQIKSSLHSLFMDYESHFDASDLDPNAYINKNGNLGYRLYYSPVDSLSFTAEARALIRNEQDRYLPGNYLKSEGLQFSGATHYRMLWDEIEAGVSANLDHRKLDWEAYQLASATANLNWISNYLIWNNSFSYSRRLDDIYNLSQNEAKQNSFYQKLDTQKRAALDIYSQLTYYPAHNMEISLLENYSERRTRLDNNIIRNNGEFNNKLQLDLNYEVLPQLQLLSRASHSMMIKDFSYQENTRHLENRGFNLGLAWEYAEYDSLIVNLGIDLQKTYFPKNNNRWDNDLRTRSSRLGWKHYYRDHIKISNWLALNLREDVYIDSLLSANNHDIKSLSYQPEVDILLGDRLCFKQSYQIRADYTDYMYYTKNTPKLYRQLAYRYSFIFDSYPYLARAGDEKWFRMPYRPNRGSAFMADISFAYEENQYADKEDSYYLIHTKNRRYQAMLTLRHDIGEFHYSLIPQYVWGTWQEYSMVAGFNWQFNNQSYFEITLTPVSEKLPDIDWRSSVNLSLRF